MHQALEPSFDRVFDTQRIFRLLLDVMARPGKICRLPALKLQPPAELNLFAAGIALTLLDSETSFAVLPENASVQTYLHMNTGARLEDASRAAFVLFNGREDRPELAGVERGHLLAPEKGATLVAAVTALSGSGGGEMEIALRGPGVGGTSTIAVSGLHQDNLKRIIHLNREFPLGVDLILADCGGSLAAVPRSSTIRREVNGCGL
ncbi:phosphonate C-P lyase system protein PhnH [Desulfotomaculum copahuensis]|uniref:Phosphonate C-P lyase system protein PhnH n=1 Tax=Desulfotomaculum copahuensis TaxID=1838280 RepID=A0A1B7LH79_9FIRM|nr:phosphonate C-P lyase system protein PhnH [Desulfotomaculum copahuensis]OAT85468.1 phosphonate C-P lyase system protein PhnH [Desulfotomaculum copahuensis]